MIKQCFNCNEQIDTEHVGYIWIYNYDQRLRGNKIYCLNCIEKMTGDLKILKLYLKKYGVDSNRISYCSIELNLDGYNSNVYWIPEINFIRIFGNEFKDRLNLP